MGDKLNERKLIPLPQPKMKENKKKSGRCEFRVQPDWLQATPKERSLRTRSDFVPQASHQRTSKKKKHREDGGAVEKKKPKRKKMCCRCSALIYFSLKHGCGAGLDGIKRKICMEFTVLDCQMKSFPFPQPPAGGAGILSARRASAALLC